MVQENNSIEHTIVQIKSTIGHFAQYLDFYLLIICALYVLHSIFFFFKISEHIDQDQAYVRSLLCWIDMYVIFRTFRTF